MNSELKELDSLTKYLVDHPWDHDDKKVRRRKELMAKYPGHHYGSPV